MSRRSLRILLLFLCPAAGCALFGASKADKSVAQWQQDTKASIREGTPEAEEKLRGRLERDRKRLEEQAAKHFEQAELSDDVILGIKTFNDTYEPDTLENQLKLLGKYDILPELLPPDERRIGHFFAPATSEQKARLQKLYKKKALLDDIRIALGNAQGVGLYLVAEQQGTVTLNWSMELNTLRYAAQVRSFEQQFDTKVGDETLQEMKAVMDLRDKIRLLMVTHTAMLAAYEGVSEGGDAKAVTELAKASKAHMSREGDVTLEDARGYIDGLGDESLDVAAALEASMRETTGDEVYERVYQDHLVRTLEVAEEAEAQVSLYDQIDASARAAKQQEFRERARTTKERLTERAKSLAGDRARGVLESLPYGKQALSGLQAVRALREGNPRAAMAAAIEAAPAGPIQSSMQLAAKVGFTAADVSKRRRRR